MKKRILSAILTLIMLVSLVPTAASAAGMSTSDGAITVLKTLEYYTKECTGSDGSVIGYGLPCTGDHTKGKHTTTETEANTALRKKVAELDTAVNNFAAQNGVSLSQNEHDALVILSYDSGTAWMNGTGTLKTAITSGMTGNDFLNAIINWREDDDNRRKIEANMYLKGQYTSEVPYNFRTVTLDPNGGTVPGYESNEIVTFYFDNTNPQNIVAPKLNGKTFLGWYALKEDGGSGKRDTQLDKNTAPYLTALYQSGNKQANAVTVDYSMSISSFTSRMPKAKAANDAKDYQKKELAKNATVSIDREFIDKNGDRWCRIAGDKGWLKQGTPSSSSSSSNDIAMDVTVTVTNSYVRSRKENNIYSAQNGTYNQGDKLRIINTAYSKYDTFLWGQVAKSETDNTGIGWVALMYTNFDSVRNEADNSGVESGTAVATATIKSGVKYVNLRNEAGTTGTRIVGALQGNTTVSLLETKFVNGYEWGRCTSGWFRLDFANVVRENATSDKNDSNHNYYAFALSTGDKEKVGVANYIGGPDDYDIPTKTSITITDMRAASNGDAWGYVTWTETYEVTNKDKKKETKTETHHGWIKLEDARNMENWADPKYTVNEDGVSVRTGYGYENDLKDTLSKGTQFTIQNFKFVSNTVWGKTYDINGQYLGWIDLSTADVTRLNPPVIASTSTGSSTGNTVTGKIATVINTDAVNVRAYSDATYAKTGSLNRGVTVAVWEEDDGWYKVDSNRNGKCDKDGDGWVSGRYLSITDGVITDPETGTTGTPATSKTGMAIVSGSYVGVNVRTGPGIRHDQIGKILTGTTIEIYETTSDGTTEWGRTDEGWVCMDYVTMVGNLPDDILASLGGTTGNGGSSSNTVTSSIYTGSVMNSAVEVLQEADDDAKVVRTLNVGDPITLHEIVTITTKEPDTTTKNENDEVVTTYTEYTANWARVNDGWIKAPEQYVALDTLSAVTYTVTGSDTLNVRKSAGLNGELMPDEQLKKGDQVSITKLDIAKDGTVWGYIEAVEGWASLGYMTEGAVTIVPETNNNNNTNTNTGSGTGSLILGSTGNIGNAGTNGFVNNAGGYRYTGTVIRNDYVNVRATPSQSAAKTTTLSKGQALVIYETTLAEGMVWGRCDAGWVYLYYVDLVPCNTAVDAKVVYTEGTIAYTDTSKTGVAGTYSRMSLVDIFEVVGTMGRTEMGWVDLINLG